MTILRLIGIKMAFIALILFLAISVGMPAATNLFVDTPVGKAVFTIGVAGEAYAAVPDYIVDGTDDHVQAQLAVDALPATGGKVIFFGGNYDFGATVTRAINNVTIEGSGKSTYFANDGGTALFSAGAQTGWVFKDFRTDAGWLTLAADTLLAGELWRGTALVSNVIASGTTMPASPVEGQQFIQDTTGRTVLYTYKEAAWAPMRSFGTMTLYVDATDGTDDLNHGTAVDANAFATIQYALDLVEPIASLGGTVTINVNGEDYGEDLTFSGASVGRVELFGTPNVIVSAGVATGGGKGTAIAAANVTGAFAPGAHDNRLVRFTSGANSGTIFPIGKTNAGAFYITGQGLTANPVGGDTYDILTWNTKTSSFHGDGSVTDIAFYYFEFDGSGSPYISTLFYFFETRAEAGYCHFTTADCDMWSVDRSFGRLDNSILQFTADNYHWAVIAGQANPDIFSTRIVGVGNNNYGIQTTYDGYVAMRGCEIEGTNNAVQGNLGGILDGYTTLVPSFIHGNNYGLYFYQHSQAFRTAAANIIYGTYLDGSADVNVTADEFADAASFSYID